jgi:hypothetical protein
VADLGDSERGSFDLYQFLVVGRLGGCGLSKWVWLRPLPGRPTVVRVPVLPNVMWAPRTPARGISGRLPKANNLSLPSAEEMAGFPQDVREYMP